MKGQRPRRASRPGRDGVVGRLIHDIAATAAVATGQHPPPARPPAPRRRIMLALRLPHTVPVCIHCRRPAGFWVSATAGTPARRP